MDKFLKQLDTYQHKYLVSKILLLVVNNHEFDSIFQHLDYLFTTSYNLLKENSFTSKTYNVIDNNIFEIENIIEEVELNLNDLVKLDLFIFLNNQSTTYLFKFYEQLILILEDTKTIKNAVNSIKPYQKNILKKFVDSLYNYLYNNKQINLINIDRINMILNQETISLNDWSNINKITDTIFKNLNIQEEAFLNEKFKFELIFFLLNVEE